VGGSKWASSGQGGKRGKTGKNGGGQKMHILNKGDYKKITGDRLNRRKSWGDKK